MATGGMHTSLFPQKTYIISGAETTSYMRELSESTVIFLVEKGVIQPKVISVKEWKVQMALGTDDNISFILTERGIQVAIEHTEWKGELRKNLIEQRLAQDRS